MTLLKFLVQNFLHLPQGYCVIQSNKHISITMSETITSNVTCDFKKRHIEQILNVHEPACFEADLRKTKLSFGKREAEKESDRQTDRQTDRKSVR